MFGKESSSAYFVQGEKSMFLRFIPGRGRVHKSVWEGEFCQRFVRFIPRSTLLF